MALKRKIAATFAALLFILLIFLFLSVLLPQKPKVYVDFLDVGQGDAILVRSGNIEMLIDGGPDRQILPQLGKTMPFFDRKIEYVVLTHPHADHFTGLSAVFDRYAVGQILVSGASNSTDEYAAFERRAAETAPVTVVVAGDSVSIGNAKAEVVWPARTVDRPKDLNDASVVLALSAFGEPAVALMGDTTSLVEEQLMPQISKLRAPILKAGHHGSRFSSSRAFLDAIRPRDAVIEVGKNSYGHPSAATLLRLKAAGAAVWRTDQDGTVEAVFTTNGYHMSRKP